MYYDCLKVWRGKSGCLVSDPNSDTRSLSLDSNSVMYQQYNLEQVTHNPSSASSSSSV